MVMGRMTYATESLRVNEISQHHFLGADECVRIDTVFPGNGWPGVVIDRSSGEVPTGKLWA